MATWRYAEPELLDKILPVAPLEGDSVIHIFEVLEGWVCKVLPGGFVQDLAKKAPAGWFARPVDEVLEDYTYSVDTLKVKMNGQVVEMKPSTKVVFLPPNYRELADDAG